MTTPRPNEEEMVVLARIARRMGFETLDTRGRDKLDFREVAVWLAREALIDAFEAGKRAGFAVCLKLAEDAVGAGKKS